MLSVKIYLVVMTVNVRLDTMATHSKCATSATVLTADVSRHTAKLATTVCWPAARIRETVFKERSVLLLLVESAIVPARPVSTSSPTAHALILMSVPRRQELADLAPFVRIKLDHLLAHVRLAPLVIHTMVFVLPTLHSVHGTEIVDPMRSVLSLVCVFVPHPTFPTLLMVENVRARVSGLFVA